MAEERRTNEPNRPTVPGEVGGGTESVAGGEGQALKPYQRKAGNWLNAYLEYTKESESPDNYHIWAALWCLSSAVRRNVWKDQGLFVLFPNLYVCFVGPPAITAKSVAIYLATKVLRQVPTIKFGSDAQSKENLIREMAEAKVDNKCALTISSSELSSIIDTSGILIIQFLTDIFDGNYVDPTAGWKYSTKTAGKDVLVNPVLNLLAGTTQSYIAESLPDNIVGHGFSSRTIFVVEEQQRQINPSPLALDAELVKALADDLRHVSNIHGQFRYGGELVEWRSPDGSKCERIAQAEATYRDFYYGLYSSPPEDHRVQGYHFRKKIHTLKVAMLLSLAEGDSLVIEERDIRTAIGLLENIESGVARAFSAVGKYEHALDVERIGDQVRAYGSGGVPLAEVMRKNYWAGGPDELSRVIAMLHKMEIAELRSKNGKEWLIPNMKEETPWSRKRK